LNNPIENNSNFNELNLNTYIFGDEFGCLENPSIVIDEYFN